MTKRPAVYVPRNAGELLDLLGYMMLKSPKFESIDNPGQGVESVFFELTEGLKLLHAELGEEGYQDMVEKAARMRAHFEADPEDRTDDSLAGREIIHEMEDVLEPIFQRQEAEQRR